jgi:hypothetical protein
VIVAREQLLHVGILQATHVAVQAKLANVAVILDQADRKGGVSRHAAELILKADVEILASAADEDLRRIEVAAGVAANAAIDHALLFLGPGREKHALGSHLSI